MPKARTRAVPLVDRAMKALRMEMLPFMVPAMTRATSAVLKDVDAPKRSVEQIPTAMVTSIVRRMPVVSEREDTTGVAKKEAKQ